MKQTMFDASPTKYNVISLGAGVQSSCMALMAARGEIGPKPDAAIFADTQAEPQSVYDWLNWLEVEISKSPYPFPVYRVTAGNLTEEQLKIRHIQKDNKTGRKAGQPYLRKIIPLYGIKDGEITAAIGRACTADYKIRPIFKLTKELFNIPRRCKEILVTQWIGISWDEVQRIKPPRDNCLQGRWPLIELKMRRHQCLEWMQQNGYPEPPRSACYYCPFHSDTEWRRLRDDEPEEFQKAIEFDKKIRASFKENDKNAQMEVYLHRSCKPLSEIDFDNDIDKGQETFNFNNECEGMCGV